MLDDIPEFTATTWMPLASRRGRIAYVLLDRETTDFWHLMGKAVRIDGENYVCRGVERHLHTPPWRAGEEIGLLVLDFENPKITGEAV